ncbi:MAG: SDR family NAD(P)-dependent oxidoreductase [Steroidobacteraceae bacterium]
MRLAGKVALVTGASRGIGAAIARGFAKQGASVVLCARNRERGEEAAAFIRSEGGTAIFCPTDVAEEEQVRSVVDATIREFGRIDVLVNNAGPVDLLLSGTDRPMHLITTQQFDAVLRVALHGPAWCCKYTLPHMMQQRSGSIINISSVAARVGLPSVPAYSAGKGGLSALTRQLAFDYGTYGIRVNAILVGMIIHEGSAAAVANPTVLESHRKRHLTRLGEPEDVVNAAVYLGSDESVFVTGTHLTVDGGALIKSR